MFGTYQAKSDPASSHNYSKAPLRRQQPKLGQPADLHPPLLSQSQTQSFASHSSTEAATTNFTYRFAQQQVVTRSSDMCTARQRSTPLHTAWCPRDHHSLSLAQALSTSKRACMQRCQQATGPHHRHVAQHRCYRESPLTPNRVLAEHSSVTMTMSCFRDVPAWQLFPVIGPSPQRVQTRLGFQEILPQIPSQLKMIRHHTTVIMLWMPCPQNLNPITTHTYFLSNYYPSRQLPTQMSLQSLTLDLLQLRSHIKAKGRNIHNMYLLLI